MIAAKVEGFRHGGDRRSAVQGEKLQLDRETLAKLFNVSSRSVMPRSSATTAFLSFRVQYCKARWR
jgi:hypothetical protein